MLSVPRSRSGYAPTGVAGRLTGIVRATDDGFRGEFIFHSGRSSSFHTERSREVRVGEFQLVVLIAG